MMSNLKLVRIPLSSIQCDVSSNILRDSLSQGLGIKSVGVDQSQGFLDINYDSSTIDFLDIVDELHQIGVELSIVEVSLKVEGMRCVSCISHVEGALNELPGVLNSTAKPSENLAEVVTIKNMVKLDDLVKIVNLTGYHASA